MLVGNISYFTCTTARNHHNHALHTKEFACVCCVCHFGRYACRPGIIQNCYTEGNEKLKICKYSQVFSGSEVLEALEGL